MRKIGLVLGLTGLLALTASASLYLESFEGDVGTWEEKATALVLTSDSSVPAAVTDGSAALKLDYTGGVQAFNTLMTKDWHDGAFFTAVTDASATTLSFDVFVPANTVVGATSSSYTMSLNIQGARKTVSVGHTASIASDASFSLVMDLTPYAAELAAAAWVTLALEHNTDAGTTSAAPIYIDNVQVIPEPATLGLISLAALGLLAVRRFKI